MASFFHYAFWYAEEFFIFVSRIGMIVQGFRDKTFGMPVFALLIQMSWHFWFSVHVEDIYLFDQIAFILDLMILFQVIIYGPKEFFTGERVPLYALLTVCMVLALGLTRALIDEEGFIWSLNQLFYCYNFVTSVLFVHMLLSRGNARGQNMFVAVSKCLALIFSWMYKHTAVVNWLCVGTLAADVVYIYLLYLCLEKPVEFCQWRNYLLSSSNNENPNVLLVNSTLNAPNDAVVNNDIIYRPQLIPSEVCGNNNNVEMAGGMP